MSKPNSLLDLYLQTRGSVPYEPAQRFLALHTIEHQPDRNGNGDDVFKGNTTLYPRDEHRHGYKPGQDIEEYNKANEDLINHIQQARKSVADRWLAAAQQDGDSNGENAMSRLAPIISQVAAKY